MSWRVVLDLNIPRAPPEFFTFPFGIPRIFFVVSDVVSSCKVAGFGSMLHQLRWFPSSLSVPFYAFVVGMLDLHYIPFLRGTERYLPIHWCCVSKKVRELGGVMFVVLCCM